MTSLSMQPTFTLNVPVSADQAIARIRRAIAQPELSSHVVSAGHCVDYKVDDVDRRFWSPHLSIQLYDTESGAEAFGRFSPRPEIWTMFMAIYFVAAICSFAAAIYAYVQWFLGASPWALTIIPVAILVIVALHIASLIGQSWSADQMQLLRARFDRTMEIAFAETTETKQPPTDVN